MHTYSKLTSSLARSQLRDPVGFFFTLVFSPLLLLALGLIFGNDPQTEFGGRGFIDNMLPGVTALSLMVVALTIVPQNQLSLRSSGALRSFRVTPLRARTYISADLTNNFALALLGAVLTLTVGLLVFDVRPPTQPLMVGLALILGLLALLALGYLLASVYPTPAAATGIGNGLMIVLTLTSGAFIPTTHLPSGLRTAMHFSPVYHLTQLVHASWVGQPWPTPSTVALAGVGLAGGVLATLLFRWDKTP